MKPYNLHHDAKGRGEKTVNLIKKLTLSEKAMGALTKKIKRVCYLILQVLRVPRNSTALHFCKV